MSEWLDQNARWIAVPGLIVALLFAAALLTEWYTVGIEAAPRTVEAYRFGSEAMVGHGGASYRSAEAYASRSLVGGLAALAFTAVFAFGLVRRSGAAVAVGYAGVVGVLGAGLIW